MSFHGFQHLFKLFKEHSCLRPQVLLYERKHNEMFTALVGGPLGQLHKRLKKITAPVTTILGFRGNPLGHSTGMFWKIQKCCLKTLEI